MTPKEKANELVEKFKDYVHGYVGSSMLSNYEYPDQILSQAKKVSLIAVNEILDDVSHGKRLEWIKERDAGNDYIVYWIEVRREIELIEL